LKTKHGLNSFLKHLGQNPRDENGWERAGKHLNHFPFLYFITENRNGSGIAGNGSENGIFGLRRRAGTGKFNGMDYYLFTIHLV
jgi:hypothetical protein